MANETGSWISVTTTRPPTVGKGQISTYVNSPVSESFSYWYHVIARNTQFGNGPASNIVGPV